jgi:hypothetical protein
MLQKIGWPMLIVIVMLVMAWAPAFVGKRQEFAAPISNAKNSIQNGLYINKQYGFQMNIPTTWKEMEDLPKEFSFVLEDTARVQMFGIVTTDGAALSRGMTFDQYVDAHKQTNEEYTMIADQAVTVSGLHGRLLKGQTKEYEGKYSTYILILHNPQMHVMYYVSLVPRDNEELGLNKKEILDTLMSFKLLK